MRLCQSPSIRRLCFLLVPTALACSSPPPAQIAGGFAGSGGNGGGGGPSAVGSGGDVGTGVDVGTGGAVGSGDTTGSGAGVGVGGQGGSAPAACAWTAETSNATCPAGSCPIVLDEQLTCSDHDLGAWGLHVAPAPDATWLATASTNLPVVYRLTAAAQELQSGVPQDFGATTIDLALAPDATVHLAADTTRVTYPQGKTTYVGGATHATLSNGTWSSSVALPAQSDQTSVVDLQVGGDGTPRMWILTGSNAFSLATPSASGWALAPAAQPPGATYDGSPWTHFTLGADGAVVSLTLVGAQLHALVGGADRTVGSPFALSTSPSYAVTPAPAPAAPTGALFAVALADAPGIRVVAEQASAPETEVPVPGTAPPTLTCPKPGLSACSGFCHETGVGVETGAYALAWTDDGVAWLAYVVTQLDQQVGFTLMGQGDGPPPWCQPGVVTDASHATLHLVRVALDGTAPEEVLSMPIQRPAVSGATFVDARGFGTDLAIGVGTGWADPFAVRVLRVDTTKL